MMDLKAKLVTSDTPKNVAGPCMIVDDEETVRAAGICCLEHGRVMAAAPELLDALRGIVESITDGRTYPEWLYEGLSQARDAIAKAEGRESTA